MGNTHHVRDGVFEPQRHESGDWPEDRQDLPSHARGGHGAPHREAHEPVAKHAFEERHAEGQGDFRGCDADDGGFHGGRAGGVGAEGEVRQHHGAYKVTGVGQRPVSHQRFCLDSFGL